MSEEQTPRTTEDAPESTSRGRLRLGLLLGPGIAIPGFFSYYTYFVRWPFFRDTAWLNIAILIAAFAISVVALRRAWPVGGWLMRTSGILGAAVSGLLAVALIAYCYVLSYQLPSEEGVVNTGERLPAITLASYDGTEVDLGTAAGPVVLVVYRGHW